MKTEWGNLLLLGNAIYHILGGCVSLGPQSWTKMFGQKLYSLEFPDKFDPKYQLTVRSLGAFALFTGVISLLLFLMGHRETKGVFLICLAGLFVLRALLRIFQRDLFLEAYKIDFKRSMKNVIFNFILASFTLWQGLILIDN